MNSLTPALVVGVLLIGAGQARADGVVTSVPGAPELGLSQLDDSGVLFAAGPDSGPPSSPVTPVGVLGRGIPTHFIGRSPSPLGLQPWDEEEDP